jgi:four helix bundle protein
MLKGGTWPVQNIQERAFVFSCRVIQLVEHLSRRALVARTIARQLLRSGMSVGANLEEATAAQSKADFISKCSIAAKEARETRYWLRLLTASQSVTTDRLAPLIDESEQIIAIVTTIVKKATESTRKPTSPTQKQR